MMSREEFADMLKHSQEQIDKGESTTISSKAELDSFLDAL